MAHQVEEQEVAVEVIGRGQDQQILFWEAAEGGTGVAERLFEDPGLLPVLAQEALRICHVDPTTGEEEVGWDARCSAACYDCLLGYANQLHHRNLNRKLVRDFLLGMARGKVDVSTARDEKAHLPWLYARLDPASTLEREFLDLLHKLGRILPDHAQHCPAPGIPVQVDFMYDGDGVPGTCVFIDGPDPDDESQAMRDADFREELRERGYRIIVISYRAPLEPQIEAHADCFGPARTEQAASAA